MTPHTHTPGPWVTNGDAIEAVLPDGSEYVAHVYSGDEAPPTGDANSNAALIAAAPDLLATLKLAARYFAENGGNESYTWLPEITATIAKAEGQAP